MAEFVAISGALSKADGTIQASIELIFDDSTNKFVKIHVVNNDSTLYFIITMISPRSLTYRVDANTDQTISLPSNARTTYSTVRDHLISGAEWWCTLGV